MCKYWPEYRPQKVVKKMSYTSRARCKTISINKLSAAPSVEAHDCVNVLTQEEITEEGGKKTALWKEFVWSGVEKSKWVILATIYPQVSHIWKLINESPSAPYEIILFKDSALKNLTLFIQKYCLYSVENKFVNII